MTSLIQTLIILLLTATLSACGNGKDSKEQQTTNPAQNNTPVQTEDNVTIVGQVTEHQKYSTQTLSIASVQVSVAGKTVQTDEQGFYELRLDKASNPVVVNFTKSGFADVQYRLDVEANSTYQQNAGLSRFQQTLVRSFNTEESIEVFGALTDPDVRLTVPQGAIESEGDVAVQVLAADPSTEFGRRVFPGEYTAAAQGSDQADTVIESIAFADITLSTQTGEKITNLAVPATLELRLPDIYQNGGERVGSFVDNADDVEKGWIEWWSYDKNQAIWVQEDADPATPEMDKARIVADTNGVLYAVGAITHFSWWNADRPVNEHACLCANIEDQNGTALSGIQLRARGISYNGSSTPGTSNASGEACVTVKRSLTVTETVSLYAVSGGIDFEYIPSASEEGNIPNSVKTPTEAGTTYPSRSGSCTVLSNPVIINMSGTVSGHVSAERDNTALANYPVYTSYGQSTLTDANGDYTIQAPIGKTFSVWASGASAIERTIFDNNGSIAVDFVILNRTPAMVNILRSAGGAIPNGQSVELSAYFEDADGDTLSYDWSLISGSAGSISASSGTTTSYTAPSSGTGTDLLRLRVSDGFSTDYITTLRISWGDFSTGSSFNLTLRSLHNPNTAIADATVVLHGADNTSIEAVKTTDATGFVSFDNLNRARVSYTIIQKVSFWYGDSHYLYSYMDVVLRDGIVHYLENTYEPAPEESSVYAGFKLTDIPTRMRASNGSPIGLGSSITWFAAPPEITYDSAAFTGKQIQNDGNVSMLFSIFNGNYDPISYGFVHDVIPVANAQDATISTLAVNHSYDELPWNSNRTGISADQPVYIRKGVSFSTGSSFYNADSGIYELASAFAPEQMRFSASYTDYPNNANSQHQYEMKYTVDTSTALPTSVSFNFSDLVVPQLSYIATDGSLNWNIIGGSERDVVKLDWHISDNNTDLKVQWQVYGDAAITSWRFPDLPPAFNLIEKDRVALETDNGYNSQVEVSIQDYGSLSSMDDVWPELSTGKSLADIQPDTTHQLLRLYQSFGFSPE